MIVTEYFYQDPEDQTILMVRINSDAQRYIVDENGVSYTEVVEVAGNESRFTEGEFVPGADVEYYENEYAKDILNIILGEVNE